MPVRPSNPIYVKVGAVLKRNRVAFGYSQGEAARRYRVTQPQLSRLENGQQGLRLEVLVRIARALQAKPSWLLEAAGL